MKISFRLTLKINKKLTLYEKIFFFIYANFIFVDIMDTSLYQIHLFWKIVVVSSVFGLLILYFVRKKLKAYQIFISCLVLVSFSIAAFSTSREYLILFALLLINADVTSFEKIVHCSKNVTLFVTAIVVLSSLIGIIPNVEFIRGLRTVYSLGFPYYSDFPYIMFYIMVMDIYCKYKSGNLTKLRFLLWGEMQYIIFCISSVRLTFYLSIIALILYIIFCFSDRIDVNGKIIQLLSIVGYPLGGILCSYVMYHYDSTNVYYAYLNHLLSDRLFLSYVGAKRYPLKLFGQQIITNTLQNGKRVENYFYIDSGFVYSLLGYGVLFSVVIICLYSYVLHYACKKNDKMIFIWGVLVLIFTLINNTWVNLTYNPLLLLFPIILKKKTKT